MRELALAFPDGRVFGLSSVRAPALEKLRQAVSTPKAYRSPRLTEHHPGLGRDDVATNPHLDEASCDPKFASARPVAVIPLRVSKETNEFFVL